MALMISPKGILTKKLLQKKLVPWNHVYLKYALELRTVATKESISKLQNIIYSKGMFLNLFFCFA